MHMRYQRTFFKDGSGICCKAASANVSDMACRCEQGDWAAFEEGGCHYYEVKKMASAKPGVVADIDVPFAHAFQWKSVRK